MLPWNKVRWRCGQAYCERRSFTESIDEISACSRTTLRLRAAIGSAIGVADRSVAEAAAAHAASRPTVHLAFMVRAEALQVEREPRAVLAIDETRRSKPRWEYCTQTQRWARGGSVGHRVRQPGRQPGPARAVLRAVPAPRSSIGCQSAPWRFGRLSNTSPSIPPRAAPRRSALHHCCQTRPWWSIPYRLVTSANGAGTKVRGRALRAPGNHRVGFLHGCLRHRSIYSKQKAWAHCPIHPETDAA